MGGLAYGRGRVTVCYQCPHSPKNRRHAAGSPGHPRTVKAPGTRLDEIVALFFAGHVFGSGRAALLAAQVPATDAAAPADRDARAAALAAKLRQLEAAQNAQILTLEQLPAGPGDTAAAAIRARIMPGSPSCTPTASRPRPSCPPWPPPPRRPPTRPCWRSSR